MSRNGNLRGWWAGGVGLLFFLLYAFTAAPSIVELYDDSLEFQLVGPTFGIAHPTGYPLYTVLGGLWSRVLFPLGNWAWRMNLFSALAGATTVALLFLLIQRVIAQSVTARHSVLPALGGALAFGLSPLWWSQTTIAEVYALHNLFVVSVLLVAVQVATTSVTPEASRQVTLVAFLLGLSLTHHRTIVLLVPGILVLWWGQGWIWRPSRTWLRWIGALLAPLLLYLYLPLRAFMGIQDLNGSYHNSWRGFWQHVLALGYTGFFSDNALTRRLTATDWAQVWQQQYGYIGLGIGLGGIGWLLWRGRNRRLWLGLLLVLLVNLTFAMRYRVGDPEVFMVPAWLIFALCIGGGVAALAQVGKRFPIGATWRQLILLALLLIAVGSSGDLVNRSQEWAIHDYAVALAKVDFPPESRLIGLEGQITALRYMQQAEGLGSDAHGIVANDPAARRAAIGAALAAGYPTFITQEVEGIASAYSFSGEGPLVRVWPRGQAAVAAPQVALDRALADGRLMLLGYDQERLAAAGGPTLRITFYWQPVVALAQAYKLSLRVQDQNGNPLLGMDGTPLVEDHYPLRGVASTTTWLAGEIVKDVHYLALPPTKTTQKQLYVVLYDAATVAEVAAFPIALPADF